jgi:hypothetical protein
VSYRGVMDQTTYWFLANGEVRVKPSGGKPRKADSEEVTSALKTLPLTTFNPVACERGR